jgi:lipopolysaccharide/colanic/teichoic acid biosynthesis glycosyltransferase
VLGPTDEGILERYRNDVRITRIGSFIRRWSIDELPQLLNVFLGHMSLVGPRPVLEEELHDLPVNGERVHLAKPGLTGLWQVSGRKEIHWEDRIDLDLEYVDTWSLGLDAKIAVKTVGAVLKGSGAY